MVHVARGCMSAAMSCARCRPLRHPEDACEPSPGARQRPHRRPFARVPRRAPERRRPDLAAVPRVAPRGADRPANAASTRQRTRTVAQRRRPPSAHPGGAERHRSRGAARTSTGPSRCGTWRSTRPSSGPPCCGPTGSTPRSASHGVPVRLAAAQLRVDCGRRWMSPDKSAALSGTRKVSTTLDIYTHVFPDDHAAAMDALGKVARRARRRPASVVVPLAR
ncbi:MAG: hypothetical protein QOF25_4245 [Mycobacterium sp.]|nr:hypothetical protein [Mycobacterium sp.]